MKTGRSTRSSQVFAAGNTIGNPFLLCRVAAIYARRLQGQRAQFADSINQSLRLISELPSGHMDASHLPPPPQQFQAQAPEPENAVAMVTL